MGKREDALAMRTAEEYGKALRAENEALLALLREAQEEIDWFGNHARNCNVRKFYTREPSAQARAEDCIDCTCGLDDLVARIDARLETNTQGESK